MPYDSVVLPDDSAKDYEVFNSFCELHIYSDYPIYIDDDSRKTKESFTSKYILQPFLERHYSEKMIGKLQKTRNKKFNKVLFKRATENKTNVYIFYFEEID